MSTPAPAPAMDNAVEMLSTETQKELNSDFHKAKWECFVNALPMTDPVESVYYMFGSDTEKTLGCI